MIKPGAVVVGYWVDEAQINFQLCSCLINITTLGRQLLQIEAISATRWNQIYASHLSLFFPTCHNQVAPIKVTKNLFSQQHLICDFICSNVIACTNLDRIWNSPKHWNSFKILTLSNKPIYRIAFTKKFAILVLKSTKNEYWKIGTSISTTISANIGFEMVLLGLGKRLFCWFCTM